MYHHTPFYFKAIAFLLCLNLFSCEPEGEIFENAVCIQNIATIDAKSGLKENQTVIIRDGKILKVSNTSDLRLSTRNEIVDGTGKYLIPGLWDTHVHYAYIEELGPYMSDLFMAYGITSLRDTGGEINFMRKWKDISEANPTTVPRLMIAGPLLDGMPNVYDGSTPGRPPLSQGLATVEELNHYIDFLDSMGVDFLKAYEMLTPQQFEAVMAKAREKGMKVTGHIPLSMDVVSAVQAGLNSIEHLRNVEMSMAVDAERLLQYRRSMLQAGRRMAGGDLRSSIHQAQRIPSINSPDEHNTARVLEALTQNQVVQIPTLALSRVFSFKEYTAPEWQESYTYLPDSIEKAWVSLMDQSLNSPISESRKQFTDWALSMVGTMHEAGIPIMAGTDTPIGFLTPGLSLHEELRLFVEAGLSPLETLASATTEPASYFNMENELGLIAEDMWADLLILAANPLEDINNTKRIETVIKQGNILERSSLLGKFK